LRAARNALLLVGVAFAFADSSIVVLALPDLLDRFDSSIQDVSWVITSYNLAVALVALATPLARRWSARRLARVGALGFGGASFGCALATNLWLLVGLRALQGAGAALLLAAALPLLGGRAGVRRFALAATIGAAAGPALGGVLTQAFDWRAIFAAQTPVLVLAFVLPPATAPETVLRAPGSSRRLAANLSLGLLTGALVGALFLVVVLMIDGWSRSPLAAAAVASAMPVGTLVGRAAGRSDSMLAPVAGAVLLAAGLASLAVLPGAALGWPVGALLLCGFGTGLALPSLTDRALAGARSAGFSVGIRHLGLVLAFVIVTPLLASSLTAGARRATLLGTAQVLDAHYPIRTKVPLAADLIAAMEHVPKGKVPDFSPQFARHPGTQGLHRQLDETVRSVVTRSFRSSFLVCALLALAALVPLRLAWGSRS
jgi:MFS family permease